MAYDPDNIFARILRGEFPNDTVAESEHTLAFRDIHPQARVHVLVIPKGAYASFDDFAATASDAEIADFHRLCARVVADHGLGLAQGGQGFRVIANTGAHGGQDVPHYHLHILGDEPMGRMLAPR